jgi:hypothetical protein
LFVCHDAPAPANNGGCIDMLGMLDSLGRLGFAVDLVMTPRTATTEIDHDRLAAASSSVTSVVRTISVAAALSPRPFQIASRHALETISLGGPYDVAIASDHCGNVFDNPSLLARWRVLRRNNDEALYARRMARSAASIAQRLFFLKEAALFTRWTRRRERAVDQVWYVSTAELAADTARATAARGPSRVLVPSALGERDMVAPQVASIASGRVLYFGSLTVPINRQAVDWFVRDVHPRLQALEEPYALTVAGRIGPAETEWAATRAGGDFTFVPNPASADAIYAPGGIFIDPLAHDAGIKLKILEAVRRGYPVVCHPHSLLGSGLQPGVHARVATDPAAMATEIAGLIADPDAAVAMARRAQVQLGEHFDIDRNIRHALAAAGL